MIYTNPIPMWRDTVMRQIKGQYTDGRGGRCALGVLYIQRGCSRYKHDEVCRFGFKRGSLIVAMNDRKGLTFQEIAQEVEADLDAWFVPEAVEQFREEARIAKEFETPQSETSIAVAVKEAS